MKEENLLVTVGVLALQGDFAEHLAVLRSLGIASKEVRTPADLESYDRLIIPGGESTVMSKLLDSTGLRAAILERAKKGTLPIFGTCAGAILLASQILGKNSPQGLGLIAMTVDRNAYGTQEQSFHADIDVKGIGMVPVAFIRAPKITNVGDGVEVIASYEGVPVLVRQGEFLAATCHPEVRGETSIHKLFLAM